MRSFTAALAVAAAILVTPTRGQAQEQYLGTITYYSFAFCPEGMLPADGRLLPISEYEPLFALLGTVFGGDGRTTFALPDLRRAVPVQATLPSSRNDQEPKDWQGAKATTFVTASEGTITTLAVHACVATDLSKHPFPSRGSYAPPLSPSD